MTYIVAPVPAEYLPRVWNDFARMLEPAVKTAVGKVDIGDLYLGIVDEGYKPWMVYRDGAPVAAFTTRVLQYPKRRALSLDWVGGRDMSGWMADAYRMIRAEARANDCQHIEGYGRAAWGRVLKRYGAKPEYVAYRLEVEDE
jgi:hypothetical protein